ncbi:MAG: LysM peptidoglycan-binding domain-containing protein [Anaerolineaceae bacterium]|nr:LysM peptidoglycan-binding domain-containing protein [Anaerolineaceae bacterium]
MKRNRTLGCAELLDDIIPKMRYRDGMILVWLLAGMVLASSCVSGTETPAETEMPVGSPLGGLTPYHTRTPTNTPLPPDPATSTPFPTPTSTPRTHIVKQGEDMYGIAFRYSITLAELMAANPEVNPNIMSVGTALIIPASAEVVSEDGALPTPTPVGVVLDSVQCHPSRDGGMWCFVLANNILDMDVESVSALVRIADSTGTQVDARVALTPLNLFPAGSHLPLIVFFPSPLPESYQVSAELLTALPEVGSEGRYLPLHIENLRTDILSDGLSVEVSGELFLDGGENAARVWVAGVAYGESGMVLGVRRWESETTLVAGSGLPFGFRVYSVGGMITGAEVFVEAQP